MADFSAHSAGGQHVVLHAVAEGNLERNGAPEWLEPQLAKRCAELTGKPCTRQLVGVTLRSTLQPKGLVASRKEGPLLLYWSPTAQARALVT